MIIFLITNSSEFLEEAGWDIKHNICLFLSELFTQNLTYK